MSEQKLEVFNVLNFLNNGYELENILNKGEFGTFSSAEECITYLVDEGYLEGDVEVTADVEISAEYISKKYIVSELKDILRENGLKVSGKKQELVERVLPLLKEAKDASNLNVSASTNNSFENLKLTDKAHEFLKENEWIDLYMFALVQFRFEDYETYVEGSSVGMIETGLNFCDEIISRALVNNQFEVFRLALSAKAHVYAYDGDYDSFLDYDLQHFILGLNPISLDAQAYATYEIINEANIINLRNVLEKLKMGSLKKRFDKIWNKSHINHVTVPKKTCYKTLLKAIDGADIEELNFEMREKFFNKKFGIQ
ncbi:SAP domain-containing protein [Methanobrevibacter sp.]|uniref:SAP domain-containing protein n=1 Tax=Methanobrevibacter sp. TaxID=66852 RepID=UPI002E75D8F6|nr:SAP domain-containing protein [Methanobrevibacter sp.]MEE1336825.1 SAP domain-containing protein [Methanobrevibacter sp.]